MSARPPKSVKRKASVIAATNAPTMTHGLNRPQRVFVLSMMLPMNGSTNSSAMRSTRMIVVTMPIMYWSWLALPELNRLLVTKIMKYVASIA